MFRIPLLVAAFWFAAVPVVAQSQDPIQQMLANFTRIDSDGDGLISRDELRSVQAARWQQIDRNRDGYLTLDDFPSVAAERAKTQLAEIGYLDANGDGRISQSEFLDGEAPVFRDADRNRDGVVTRSELEAAAS